MGNIIGEPLQNFLKSQINARQKLYGSGVNTSLRSDLQLNVLNSKTAWVKLASGVSVDASRLKQAGIPTNLSGTKLARTYILNSGFSRLEGGKLKQRDGFKPQDPSSSYTYGNFGYSPMPGIKSVDVKTLNRGSIKKATVRLMANNLQQFNIIEVLYLRLGYTVLLEWGNSLYTTNGENRIPMKSTVLEESFFGEKDFNLILDKITYKRAQKYGNYDGFIGKVSNFSWTVLEDGGYDIEITVISMGDVIESLKSNITPDVKTSEFINATGFVSLDLPKPKSDEGSDEGEGSDPVEENKDKSAIHAMLFVWKYLNPENRLYDNSSILTIRRQTNDIQIGYLMYNKPELSWFEKVNSGIYAGETASDEISIETITYEHFVEVTRFYYLYWTAGEKKAFHYISDANNDQSIVSTPGWYLEQSIKDAFNGCNNKYIGGFRANPTAALQMFGGGANFTEQKIIAEDVIGAGNNYDYKSTRFYTKAYIKNRFSIPAEKRNDPNYLENILFTEVRSTIQQKYETFGGKEYFGDTTSEPPTRWEAVVDANTWGFIKDDYEYEANGGIVPLDVIFPGSKPPSKIKIFSPLTSFSNFSNLLWEPPKPVGGNNGDGITTITIPNPIADAGPRDAVKLTTQKTSYYLRFGYLLQYLQKNVVPRVDVGKSYKDNPQFFTIDYSSVENVMFSLPDQISLDPRVCIVRNDKFTDIANGNEESRIFSQMLPWRLEDSPPSKKIADENFSSYLMNVYLNFNFIMECFSEDEKGNVSIFEFIKNICDGINKAMGGINNLEPTIDETKNRLKIRDTTPIPGTKRGDESLHNDCTILLTGYDKVGKSNYISNFIRKADIKTAITPEYATMMTIGATAKGYVKGVDATAFSKWNNGITDRYKEEVIPANQASSDNGKPEDDQEPVENYRNRFLQDANSKYASRFGFSGDFGQSLEFNDSIISNNIAIASEYYKFVIAQQKLPDGKQRGGGTIGFIPFKISITMDGLSGFKIYNKITVDTKFLPKAYGENVDLIVTGITHKIQDDDWTTEIEATVMPKSDAKRKSFRSKGNQTKFEKRPPKQQSSNTEEDVVDNNTSNTTSTSGKATGDLYIWSKGPSSTTPENKNNYLAAVLKGSVSGNPIPKPVTPLKIQPGFPRNQKNKKGREVLVTKYVTTPQTPAEDENFFKAVLTQLGAPSTPGNLIWLKAWRQAEGAKATYNPFNSTQPKSGSTNFNTVKVKNYFTVNDGVTATVSTINNGQYKNIIKAFKKGIPNKATAYKLAQILQQRNPTQQEIDNLINSF
jgi:hypothetical protein